MGVLYARVSGAWVPVQGVGAQGPSGGPVPVGGAVGDLIIKNGTADFAVRWGIDPPKVRIPTSGAPSAGGAGGDAHGLTVGLDTDYNVAVYGNGVMARNNGAATLLRLNYYGNEVIIGGGSSAQFPLQLVLAEGPSTSKRAYMKFGTGWEIGQDWGGLGTRDLYVWNSTSGLALKIDPSANIFGFGHGTGQVDLNLDGSTAANALVPRVSSNMSFLNLHAKTDLYLDGDTIYFRSAAYVARGNFNSAGAFNTNGPITFANGNGTIDTNGTEIRFRTSGNTDTITMLGNKFYVLNSAASAWILQYDGTRWWTPYNLNVDGELYCARYMRVTGAGGFYLQDYNVGWVGLQNSWMQTYGPTWVKFNGGISMNGNPIRFYADINDNNHRLQYTNATPPGSGEASNGPALNGYSSVWLSTNTGAHFFLASAGSVFLIPSGNYNKFSSREFKDNIIALDPNECLDQVRRWRPVEYDVIADGRHTEGFISEDHVAVTPAMVNVCGPESERPGWANAIAYEMATPRLAGAIQALAARIEQLEGKAA
jgi:hypothetical protein